LTPHLSPTQLVDDVLAVRATHAEQDRAFFKMSPAQSVAAMWRTLRRDGQPGVPMRTLYAWARRLPDEVPLIDGEFAFIAALTPEHAERLRQPTGAPRSPAA
jgi:hypothetical protein